MFQFLNRSIQYKLTFAILLALLIPAVITTFYNLDRSRESLTEVVRLNQEQLIQAKITDIEKQLAEPEDDLIALVQSSEIRRYVNNAPTGDTAQDIPILENYFINFETRTGQAYRSICLLDSFGFEVICAEQESGEPTIKPADALADRFEEEYFTSAISQTGHLPGRSTPISISSLQINDTDDPQPVMYYSTLLQTDDGIIGGVLVLEANIEPIFETISENVTAEEIYLVDRNGVYWLHPDESKLYQPDQTITDDRPNDAQTFAAEASGVLFGSEDFPDDLISFGRVRPEGQVLRWSIIYEQPLDTVLGDITETQNVIIAITVVSLVIAFAIAVLLTRSIVLPITRLATATTNFIESPDKELDIKITNQDEIGQLAQAFTNMTQQIRELIQNLEERVIQRTRDLEISAEVSKQISTQLDSNVLLTQIVELTTAGFELYHASIFLYEPENERLRYVQGSGLAGQKMLSFSKQFRLDQQGLVPTAARTKQSALTNDTYTDSAHLANPLLPETRAEIAIPMLSGDTLVGVLDLQAKEINRFTPDDIRIMETLAEQLAVAIRNAQLFEDVRDARQLAEESNKVKSMFLASMSHELRTPLNAVINFAKFLRRGIMGPVTDKQIESLDKIIGSGKHLLSLINDVLDISKIESGSFNLFIEDNIDLQAEFQKSIQTAETLLMDKPVELRTEVPDTLPRIVGDRQRIQQIMLNILGNACKFTKTGYVAVSVKEDNDFLKVSIQDTGPGISQNEMDAIFEPFTQTDAGIRQGGGTGLGLPISKRLIEAHGGDLLVESTPNEGSTFTFTLPLNSKSPLKDMATLDVATP